MSESTSIPENASFEQIGEVLRNHQSFVLISHVRPDGDAIGSQLALGYALMAAGKSVRLINEDGLPDNLAFMAGSEKIELPPAESLDVEVAIALDLIDSKSPATGQILYQLILALGLPMPAESRDAIYVAVSTDTGSFQYPSTTAATYELGADLIRRGLDVGTINSLIYDNYPFRRLELMRALLNTLELSENGLVANWTMRDQLRIDLDLLPEDSEGLIDLIRAIRGVQLAVFFEELPDGKIRISMRSKDRRLNVLGAIHRRIEAAGL